MPSRPSQLVVMVMVMVMVILADLAAPGRCLAAAELRVALGMTTRHPGCFG
jgi:hypothetical protein